MRFICSRWENAGFGDLLEDALTFPHKPKDLKVKPPISLLLVLPLLKRTKKTLMWSISLLHLTVGG
jgi:hypothetical protein